MKYIASILLIILNIINIPLTYVYMKVQKWYLPLWHKDRLLYILFAPFYWILVAVSTIIGYPCEILMEFAH